VSTSERRGDDHPCSQWNGLTGAPPGTGEPRTSTKCRPRQRPRPCGETRWVRPPRPGGPRSCGCSCGAALPGWRMSGSSEHIEQPVLRHSAPAERKIRSRPPLGLRLTCADPGTTGRAAVLDRLPSSTDAATRRSSIRPLCRSDERSTGFLDRRSGTGPCRRALAAPTPERSGRRSSPVGTRPLIGTDCAGSSPGDGRSSEAASMTTVWSYGPQVAAQLVQAATAASQSAPRGAKACLD